MYTWYSAFWCCPPLVPILRLRIIYIVGTAAKGSDQPAKAVTMVQLNEGEVEELMKFMDVDRSGSVKYEEFVVGMLEEVELLSATKLHVAFDYLDKDHNGLVDVGELHLEHSLLAWFGMGCPSMRMRWGAAAAGVK